MSLTPSPTFSLRSAGVVLDPSPSTFGELRRSDPSWGVEALKQRFDEDGYLFLPGLLDRDQVLAVRLRMLTKLQELGYLDSASPLEYGKAREGANCAFLPELANGDFEVERLLYEGAIPDFFQRFLGGEIKHYDYTWLRTVAPGKGTNPHCDIVFMGRGTAQLYTAWTPLDDIDTRLGGLIVLENSHRRETLKETYCRLDVDERCSNEEGGTPLSRAGFLDTGAITNNPADLRQQFGSRWLTTDFKAGDVLIFGMFTVHASLDNQSDRIRLSTDSRYQLAGEPVDERWVGERPVGHSIKRETIC
ncbi:MAG TPA: phytanoyl-CoA dioxygenase family protein [Fimbriimonadaceae bacterium]|nr:phytanoyl-CoA dioxygenase family protein [Fimbriimonadaceae bacterium]